MARVVRIDRHQTLPLADGWALAKAAPGAIAEPGDPRLEGLDWMPAEVPGTVASALRARGRFDWDAPGELDASDWFYRCRFAGRDVPAEAEAPRATRAEASKARRSQLRFEGLASLADVWLNGTRLFDSDHMFLEQRADVTTLLRAENDLLIRFRSLDAALGQRRPRPRWRTRLVERQNLRYVRTTLLGRMRAFTPPVPPIGPFRPVQLETIEGAEVLRADVRSETRGTGGALVAALLIRPLGPRRLVSGALLAGGARAPLSLSPAGGSTFVLRGELELPGADRWWPHTHGPQPLVPVGAIVELDDGAVEVDLGRAGFRSIAARRDRGEFSVEVNGEPVFCRGACWTTADLLTLGGDERAYRSALELAKGAGMNMLRLPGTNPYESGRFYELCDELGILVWQDFAFANMDYPGDADFSAKVKEEVEQFLARTQLSPSLAVLCGNSEVEQQAAMLGLARETFSPPLFRETIPAAAAAARPDVPYVRSSPSGGALPFHPREGIAHYYGVGAYLRPLEDARRAEVRFSSECLAFANIPEDETLASFLGGGVATPVNFRWKARAPRDAGGSWDFDDVRDHYLERMFATRAVELRSTDIDRYLALGRVVTGEVMAAVFAEWRRGRSTCRGGLVFTFQDVWPGPGFGVVDALGRPKAAYYYLKRAFSPVAVFLSDEGNSGLFAHVIHEGGAELVGELAVDLYRDGRIPVGRGVAALRLAPRSTEELAVDGLLDHFADTSYAYRFGPPGHDLVVASLLVEGQPRSRAFHFPLGWSFGRAPDLGLRGEAARLGDGAYAVTVTTVGFAQSVKVEAPGYIADDNYFHLEPGGTRSIMLRPERPAAPFSASLSALNTTQVARIAV